MTVAAALRNLEGSRFAAATIQRRFHAVRQSGVID
jgi:hypothetical protein